MQTRNKPRLGRGLSALMSDPVIIDDSAVAQPGENAGGVHGRLAEIQITEIDDNPHQPREKLDPAALAELAASIKSTGVLQPVIVREHAGRYQLIAGHRRTSAARQAGLTTVPALVRNDSTDEQQVEWALIENIQRQDLNPIERARAYRTYVQRFELTHAQAAERLGEDRTTISNFLRLLDLNPGVQDMVGRGLLSAGHAKVLAGVADASRQDALANRCVLDGLSVRKLEELMNEPPSEPVAATTEISPHTRQLKSAHIVELEQALSRKLGTKLRIMPAQKKGSGKIVIQYFSLDDFDRLTEIMGYKQDSI